jgi:hypothetical protein
MTSKYQRQLDYLFNRPTDEPEWYWGTDYWEEGVFDDNTLDTFTFLETLLAHPKDDLAAYSDAQIGLGLNYIFNSSCSNMTHEFMSAKMSFDHKMKVLHGLFALFRDVLNPRCAEITSAFSQDSLSKINYICYMFWDITPLCMYESLDKNEVDIYNATIADIMKKCLRLSNPACVESGLHGLGHLAFNHPKIAVPIIDNFLKNGKCKNESLINYAKSARTGMIP